jgi:glucosylglycerate phosphorylase
MMVGDESDFTAKARQLLQELYGPTDAEGCFQRLLEKIAAFRAQNPTQDQRRYGLSQRDAVLITYGDMVRTPGQAPLATLYDFLSEWVGPALNTVHLLPFYPYSSDDGFSVLDYRAVDPRLGTWNDVERLASGYRLMFDAVLNHVSAGSKWFQAFLQGDPERADDFIRMDSATDLSAVVRPRTSPVLTPVETVRGLEHVWTTFSADQIDLNYRNPGVLLEMLDLLLFYVSKGASLIRLDAIAYLWKEVGTDCIHRPQTHAIIHLMRRMLDRASPSVALVTETNVPHTENVSYFGDGHNEAQLVYNFALPPLVLHSLYSANARALSEWASTLELPSGQATFFNFLASHDGIGLNPVRGILGPGEIESLVSQTMEHGGLVSQKADGEGRQSPYELNINYFDAVNRPDSDEAVSVQVDRFMVAQSIMLALVGVPGIYFHSLFGSRGWRDGVAETGRARSINREKLRCSDLERELRDSGSRRHLLLKRTLRVLVARAGSMAFHPTGGQEIVDLRDAVFSLWRISPDRKERVLCLHNLADQPQVVQLPQGVVWTADLIEGPTPQPEQDFSLGPYQVAWLRAEA